MKISVLIPTYNRARFLGDAIRSALNQDYKDIEVIVSDNASTDDTYKVVSQFFYDKRFKYYRNDKNIGMVENFNNLLRYVSGDYFIFLCSDDFWPYNLLTKYVKNMKENCVIFCNSIVLKKELQEIFKNPFLKYKKITLYDILSKGYGVPLSSVLYPKKVADSIKFNTDLRFNFDFEFFVKAVYLFKFKIKFLKDVFVYVRVNEYNETLSFNVKRETLKLNFKLFKDKDIKIFYVKLLLLIKIIKNLILR